MSAKPAHTAPHGMEPYDLKSEDDLGALSPEQQDKLNQFKVKMFQPFFLKKRAALGLVCVVV